jgi:hypothetical protein
MCKTLTFLLKTTFNNKQLCYRRGCVVELVSTKSFDLLIVRRVLRKASRRRSTYFLYVASSFCFIGLLSYWTTISAVEQVWAINETKRSDHGSMLISNTSPAVGWFWFICIQQYEIMCVYQVNKVLVGKKEHCRCCYCALASRVLRSESSSQPRTKWKDLVAKLPYISFKQ